MPKEFREPVVNFGFRHPDENQPKSPATPVPEPAPAPPEISAAFRKKAEAWKRDLLDVSRRNRAINFRASSASLLLPVDAEELWNSFVATDGSLSLSARNFAPDSATPNTDERALAAFTAATRLAERARLADREQGIQVLFLALGWLDWIDSDGEATRSPLVLAPVEVTFDRQGRSVVLQAAADDPPELNPSLAYLLQAQAGIRLGRLEDAAGELAFASLGELLAAVRETVAPQDGWRVETDGPLIDVFAFAKLAMVDEIDRSIAQLAAHPLLKALAGEAEFPQVAFSEATDLDARFTPGELRTVVESDAYQLHAVAMAASGHSFVIEGPPGTGKSQTITNIAAELMAQGKRVLFVAEKRVAREVVLENLQTAGLGEACLHLASNAGAASRADAKAQVIQEIVATLDAGPPPAQPDPAVPARYADLRQRLNAYAEGVSAPQGDGGWTNAVEVFAEAARTAVDRTPAGPIPPLPETSRFWWDDVSDHTRALDAALPSDLAFLAGPWAELRWSESERAVPSEQLAPALALIAGLPDEVRSAVGDVLAPDSLEGLTIDGLRGLAASLAAVARYRKLAASPLKFLRPTFYSARADMKRFRAAAYRETGNEGVQGEQLERTLASAEPAFAAAIRAFGSSAPATAAVGLAAHWAEDLLPGMNRYGALANFARELAGLETLGVRTAATMLLAETANHGRVTDVLRATIYGAWANTLAQGELAASPEQHARLVESFARLDTELLGWSRTSVLAALRAHRPRSANHAAMAPLLKYARAKRRPALRTMLGTSREAVQLLKPCLLMSPLAAAQYLCHGDGRTYQFDAVIVDEASMVPTPDMVVALGLAPQAIIVGDSKQMPPTNFFAKEIRATTDDEEAEITFESILDETAPLLPSTMLRAHYRSRDEALIAFSNVYFYDGRLIAFPDAWGSRPESGVTFEFVTDAVYGRGKSRANPAEARRAIELLRAELARPEGPRQVAITAMSMAQQQEILDQLSDSAALEPALREWLDSGGQVRNLETVQGDESDVMILSVGYGKDADGRLTMNFGPLGLEKGERRLNVAITRAKWKTVVVTSLRSSDIDPSRTASTGTLRLRDYLDYADRGPAALPEGTSAHTGPLSAFESVVMEALSSAGVACVERVGVAGFQVPIALRHATEPERFVLAVICDGPAYAGAPNARDRELGRTAALRRMGWEVHRVLSPAWYRDPEAELNRLIERYRSVASS